MKKLTILVIIASLLSPLASIDWDPSGNYYPEDTKGVPLLQNINKEMYLIPASSKYNSGISVDLKNPQTLESLLRSKKNWVATLETLWWAESKDQAYIFGTVNTYKKPYIDVGVTRNTVYGGSSWGLTYFAVGLKGDEDILNFSLNIFNKKGKVAFYQPTIKFEENLLVNGDAEAVPVTENGWSQVSGDWSKTRVPKSKVDPNLGGPNSFWPGASAEGILEQEIPLQRYKAYLNSEMPLAVLGGYMTTFDGDKDTAEMVLQSLDGAGNVIESTSSSATNFDFWTYKGLGLRLSPKVAKLKVQLIGKREKGQNLDAYFDNLMLFLPGSGPASQYDIAYASYEPESNKPKRDGEESLAAIPGLSKPYPVIPSNKNTQTIEVNIDDAVRLNDVPQHVYTYTPTVGEYLTLQADRQGVAVQIIEPSGYFIQDDGKMASKLVHAHLLPNQTYTIILSDYVSQKSGTYKLTISKSVEALAGREEEKMTAFFGDKRLYLQKLDFPSGKAGFTIRQAFNDLCPQIDGKALRIYRFEAKAGQKLSFSTDTKSIDLKIYDSLFTELKSSKLDEGAINFTAPKAGVYWILAKAPRMKFYREFSLTLH